MKTTKSLRLTVARNVTVQDVPTATTTTTTTATTTAATKTMTRTATAMDTTGTILRRACVGTVDRGGRR